MQEIVFCSNIHTTHEPTELYPVFYLHAYLRAHLPTDQPTIDLPTDRPTYVVPYIRGYMDTYMGGAQNSWSKELIDWLVD